MQARRLSERTASEFGVKARVTRRRSMSLLFKVLGGLLVACSVLLIFIRSPAADIGVPVATPTQRRVVAGADAGIKRAASHAGITRVGAYLRSLSGLDWAAAAAGTAATAVAFLT